MVTHEQLIDGVTKFVTNDVLSKIDDKALRIIIDTALALLKRKPEMIDKYVNNALFKTDKGYDIDTMVQVIKESLNKNGAFPIVIPAVPFISPTEKILSFCADDVDALSRYIKGEKN